jgi:hypothetical protein
MTFPDLGMDVKLNTKTNFVFWAVVGALGFKIFVNFAVCFSSMQNPIDEILYMVKHMFNRERSLSSTCEKVSIAGMRSIEYVNKLLFMKKSATILYSTAKCHSLVSRICT